ncbi:3-hydroxyisobutyrate dehydrogenase [Nocardia sp. GAS34]|uniref:NAD(P)-dependent oxidoreductase n=1 Tax=unclassified Nocardia TaxID=2637762 RepID=UPI003D241985
MAVLGTGTMGAAMAANIAGAAMGLRVWNRNRELAEPLADVGAVVCDSPADAVRGADAVLTTLADEAIVAEVMDKAREGLSEGVAWVQSATVAPEGSRRLAEQAHRLGTEYVEAPLLGTKEPAIAGTLTVLAASTQADTRARVQPLFDAIGSRTLWLDHVGQPSALKLAYNAWVLATVEGIAESLTLAEALGVDPMLVIDAIGHSGVNSDYVQTKGPRMISDDLDTPSFPLQAAAKDAGLITDAARAAGLRLGIAETVRERLHAGVREGLGRTDVAATYRLSRRVPAS